MNRYGRLLAVLVVAVSILGPPAAAQTDDPFAEMRKPLVVGDPVPPLPIKRWVAGDKFDASKIEGPYVVIFNITSCPTCRKALPFVSDLYEAYGRDVPIVNVFAHELPAPNDPEDIKSLEKVSSLLSALGDKVDMPVGVDGPQREIGPLWGIWSFPSAYLVLNGRIAWVGEPSWLPSVLADVQAGTFDPQVGMQEQAEYDTRKNAVQTAVRDSSYDEAIKIVDAIIADYPDESSLYFLKYETLLDAGRLEQAEGFLRWLIESDPERFDWDHFVPLTYLYPEQPNYTLSLGAADRAISHAEWDLAIASLLSWKARIYLDRHDSNKERDGRDDIDNAIEAVRKAVAISKESGDRNDQQRFQAELSYYQFRFWAGVKDGRASKFLKSVLMQEMPRVDWVGYIEDSLRYQDEPDYALLLWAADRALIEAFDETMEADALAQKGAVYAAMENYVDAITLYEKAIARIRYATNQDSLSEYEAALSKLRDEI